MNNLLMITFKIYSFTDFV